MALLIGDRREPTGELVPVTPGKQRLVLRTEAGEEERVVSVRAEEVRIIEPTMLPALAPEGEPEAARPKQIGAWLAVGVGAVSAVGAGYMGVLLNQTQSDYEHARNGPDLDEQRERGDNYAIAANVLWATTAVAAGVAIWLFIDD